MILIYENKTKVLNYLKSLVSPKDSYGENQTAPKKDNPEGWKAECRWSGDHTAAATLRTATFPEKIKKDNHEG
jgi:hypothetical protein